jgi:drug/metabolite transporter (DMT)-like permease
MSDETATRPDAQIGANLGLFLSTAIWATMFPVTEALLATWDPYLIALGRLGVAAVVLTSALCLTEGRAAFARVLPWGRLWILGGGGIGVSIVLMTFGIKYSGSVTSAIIAAASPIIAAFMARFLFAIPVRLTVVVGAVVAVAGGLLATLGGGAVVGDFGGGELLVLTGISIWVWYSQLAQRWLTGFSQLAITTLTMITGVASLVIATAVLMLLDVATPTADLSWRSVRWILYLGCGPASFCLFLWHYGVSRMGVTIASMYGNLVPVVVVLIAIFSGVYPVPAQLAGGALIIAGVLIAQSRRAIAVPPR